MRRLIAAPGSRSGCGGGGGKTWQCQSTAGTAPDYLTEVGCLADFEALASEPLDASIPGARSVKVVLDQFDDDALYFQNSNKFQIHYEFAAKHLSGPDHPLVPSLTRVQREPVLRRPIAASCSAR